jgi:galactose-1-phosphate uridylyltransferase
MPASRRDPIVDRWVVISSERNERPSDIGAQAGRPPTLVCPFCPGHDGDDPAITPFASRCPCELWIIPKEHDAWFESNSGVCYGHLAGVSKWYRDVSTTRFMISKQHRPA